MYLLFFFRKKGLIHHFHKSYERMLSCNFFIQVVSVVQRHTFEQTDRQQMSTQTDRQINRQRTDNPRAGKLTQSFSSVEITSESWNFQIYRFLWLLRLNESLTLVCRV